MSLSLSANIFKTIPAPTRSISIWPQGVCADKTEDDDYYILILAAIARELNVYGLTPATVRLAVGLPLTWVSQQREDFKACLMRNRDVSFTFRGKAYRVEIAGADVFPQGFAAVASRIRDFQGVNMLCDIGDGVRETTFKRPGLDAMVDEIRAGNVVTVIVKGQSKISVSPSTPLYCPR